VEDIFSLHHPAKPLSQLVVRDPLRNRKDVADGRISAVALLSADIRFLLPG
jgi:hypothetical protein